MSRFRWSDIRDAVFPAFGSARTIINSGSGKLKTYGSVKPTNGVTGYAPHSTFIAEDGLYENVGSVTSCDFKKLVSGGATAGTAAGRGPSPAIWDGAPILDVVLDPTLGHYVFDDFTGYGGLALAANGSDQGLTLVERTDGTLANAPTLPGGIVQMSSVANTADQGGSMHIYGLQLEPKAGTTIRMEWRAMVSEDGGQCFMGLADDSISAVVDSNDAIVTNKNLCGFFRDTGVGDADWSVGVCDATSSEESNDVVTSVKTTYHKYGIVIEGIGGTAGSSVKFYFDGVLVYTTADVADLPLLLVSPVFQMDGDGTDIVTMSIDWLRVLHYNSAGTGRES